MIFAQIIAWTVLYPIYLIEFIYYYLKKDDH